MPWVIDRRAVEHVEILIGRAAAHDEPTIDLARLLNAGKPAQRLKQILLSGERRQALQISNGNGNDAGWRRHSLRR